MNHFRMCNVRMDLLDRRQSKIINRYTFYVPKRGFTLQGAMTTGWVKSIIIINFWIFPYCTYIFRLSTKKRNNVNLSLKQKGDTSTLRIYTTYLLAPKTVGFLFQKTPHASTLVIERETNLFRKYINVHQRRNIFVQYWRIVLTNQ